MSAFSLVCLSLMVAIAIPLVAANKHTGVWFGSIADLIRRRSLARSAASTTVPPLAVATQQVAPAQRNSMLRNRDTRRLKATRATLQNVATRLPIIVLCCQLV